MLIFQQNLQIFSKDLKYFSKILQNTTNFDNHLRFAAIPANSMKIAAKMTGLNENSSKFCKNHEKIVKINDAKDCKFDV